MDEITTCTRSKNVRAIHCSQARNERKSFLVGESDVGMSRKRKLTDSCHEPCHQTPMGQSSKPLAMSPAVYLSAALRNKSIPSRVCHLSLEQALYFEPYREAQIPAKLLRALRSNDFTNLEGMEMNQLRSQRNSFGESLTHLVCRSGLPSAKYLIEQIKMPLNVRDKFGRSPLHNACLAAIPDFKAVKLILKHAPKLVIFEDNKGRTPFDYISARNRAKWSRFLSEDGVLVHLQIALKKEQEKEESEKNEKLLRISACKKSLKKESCKLVPKESGQNPTIIDREGRPNECIMKLFSRKPISFAPSLSSSQARLKAPLEVQLS